VRTFLRRATPPATVAVGRRRRRNVLAGFVLGSAATLSCAVAAAAAAPAATDLPTQSSAYNAAWQPAPAGYVASRDDGLGVSPGQVKHVWVIVLENHAYDSSFTPLEGTASSYLQNLPSQGALLTNYYGTGHSSLDNYLAMVSGQAPQADDQDDCPSYDGMTGSIDTSGTPATNADYGQFESSAGPDAPPNDNGCVYPSSVKTIFNQLDGAGKTWKVYAQDQADAANAAVGQDAGTTDCGAPESKVGAAPTSTSPSGQLETNDGSANSSDQYVAKHNPLPWFESLLPSALGGTGGNDCANDLASVFPAYGSSSGDSLYADLQRPSSTPDFSFIVPNNCNNGHDAVCAGNNLSGEAAGFPAYNTSSEIPAAINSTGGTYAESLFLGVVVPEIEASPAFKQGGLIVVTYDEAYPPFTYSNDSQANSQLQSPDAAGSLINDAAGETLYGRSLSWEPTGPNATIVKAPSGQVLTAGPGDSAYIDRPKTADGDLIACNEPTLNGTDTWVPFTAPTSTNGQCIPGFQANAEREPATAKTTASLTIAANSGTVPYTTASAALQGEQVTFNGSAPTLSDGGSPYSGSVFVGAVTDTPQTATSPTGAAYVGSFQLVDAEGNPVTVPSGYTGTLTLTAGDASTDPFYDAFDATLGGGDTGAVLISPYIRPGTVSNTYYNHYSLLRSLEDVFGISWGGVDGHGHLGFAAQPGLATFGTDVFTNSLGWGDGFGWIRRR
jgi:hypothetical protein